MRADVTDQASVREVLEQAAAAHGGVDLVVNAASAYGGDRSGPFGGGPIAEAPAGRLRLLGRRPGPLRLHLPLGLRQRSCSPRERPATVIQATGGSSRRAAAGRGLWAAGAFGVRAITQAAALELREHGIHVALLIVDAGIQPLGDAQPPQPAAADPRELAAGGALPRRPGRPRGDARAAGHPARGALGSLDRSSRFELLQRRRLAAAPPPPVRGVLGADQRHEHGDEQRRDGERRDDRAERARRRRRRSRHRGACG